MYVCVFVSITAALDSILQDTEPELSEVFIVRLISVTLVGVADSSIAPSLGDSTVAQVTILPNDNPQGIISFAQPSFTVPEDVGSVDIIISREEGAFGEVSAVYNIINSQARNGEDFSVVPVDNVVFPDGQSQFTLNIPIFNDTLPEVEEEFCVELRLPRGGVLLGNTTTSECWRFDV